MGLLAQPLDYTDKDFDSLLARCNNLIDSVFPTWSDRNRANFGNILVSLFCFAGGDVLTKYQDAQGRETRWTQATQRKNLLALVALIGYPTSGITAAQAQETFTLAEPAANDVVIRAGSTVSTLTATPITYQLLDDLTIPAGVTQETATVENSAPASDSFSSTGLPNQTFTASTAPYIDASAAIVAADGTYTQAANLLNAGPTGQFYTVTTDSNGYATFSFGDGVNGAIPQGEVAITYKVGGGSAGRVDQGTLVQLNGQFADVDGNAVSISVTNAAPSSGGLDAESNAQIQTLAPLSVQTAGARTIADSDYTNQALLTPGVARALFTSSNQDPGVRENHGILYLVPPGAGTASASLIAAVQARFVANPYPTCFRLSVRSAPYQQANVQATAYPAAGTTPAAMNAGVLAALQSLFADTIGPLSTFRADGTPWAASATSPNPDAGKPNPLIDFGYNLLVAQGGTVGTIAWSDVYEAISLSGVVAKLAAGPAGLLLNGAPQDLPIARNQFPVLGTVALINGLTGQAL